MIRKLIIAVFLAPILLFGQELTEKVVFDHTDLSDPEVKTIQVDMFSTTPTCNREVINKRVEVLFTVGDRYQYGNNSFYTKVQAVKLVPKVDGSPCPGAVVYTVELSEENPEMVIVYEINMGPNAINDFSIDVETEGYITDPVVQDSVRLEVSYKYEVVHYPDGTNDIAVNVPVSINNRVTFSWESDCYYKNYELQVLKLNNTSVAFANSDVLIQIYLYNRLGRTRTIFGKMTIRIIPIITAIRKGKMPLNIFSRGTSSCNTFFATP